MRVLELFCGLGGVAAALGDHRSTQVEIAAAVDLNRDALEVYSHNFPRHPTAVLNLAFLTPERLASWDADLWWMSPPCQPFTRRGERRDADDPRSRPLLRLIELAGELRPPALALENVPGFEGSETHGRLRRVLEAAGYEVGEHLLCPTEWGLPGRRRRFYLVASRQGLAPLPEPPRPPAPTVPLAELLDDAPEPDLEVEPELLERYRWAVDVVDAGDPGAVAATFTSAYGRSPVRSGSYVRSGDGTVRRVSPREILRLLGFPETYELPPSLDRAKAWRLVGNSLALPPVEAVLGRVVG